MVKLFVYGTLKKGFHNHSVLERSNGKFIGKGYTLPIFTMYNLGHYPAVTLLGNTAIQGEVWEVDDLQHTDWLEGYPKFYDRRVISIQMEEGGLVEASLYYIKEDHTYKELIEEGEWR